MNDEQRNAKDEAGPEGVIRWKVIAEPADEDTEGHMPVKWHAIEGDQLPSDTPTADEADAEGARN